jgi:hypothetical protein
MVTASLYFISLERIFIKRKHIHMASVERTNLSAEFEIFEIAMAPHGIFSIKCNFLATTLQYKYDFYKNSLIQIMYRAKNNIYPYLDRQFHMKI